MWFLYILIKDSKCVIESKPWLLTIVNTNLLLHLLTFRTKDEIYTKLMLG